MNKNCLPLLSYTRRRWRINFTGHRSSAHYYTRHCVCPNVVINHSWPRTAFGVDLQGVHAPRVSYTSGGISGANCVPRVVACDEYKGRRREDRSVRRDFDLLDGCKFNANNVVVPFWFSKRR